MPIRVLIVSKTRQGNGACVGGITREGQSVRLISPEAETHDRVNMEYTVGDVWEMEATPAAKTIPPHVENVIVRSKRKVKTLDDPIAFIERNMPPAIGPISLLYNGLLQTTTTNALYIAERTGIPSYSTTFWRPDRPLQRMDGNGKRVRYCYPADDGPRTLVFVGFQEPVLVIPAGALVRVSLAHWWRPTDDEEGELRCYAQLSGWFISPQDVAATANGKTASLAYTPCPGAPHAAAVDVSVPDMTAAARLLKSVFGYDEFRPMQDTVIANLLQRRDTLAIMPTGSGKSLCYQLPALMWPGLTVVVSPLISLMKDQVDQLREMGVPAVFLNSSLEYDDYVATAARVRRGEIKLLYTSPETLLRPETLVMLDACRVDYLAIDEAHCISAWGHDFRPEYRQLLPVRQRYPGAVCVAFTATATPRVQQDITRTLDFRDENAFVASFDRPNLYLAAERRTDGLAQVLSFLSAHRGQSGIIYCSTRERVDTLTVALVANGWPALPYHAGLEDDVRRANQERFSRDETPIIVATIAFGMGINKSNVRFVVHHNLPQSIESYYQEIGRAGRDGLRADCLLLYSGSDLYTMRHFIDQGAEAERQGRHARLQAIARYAEAQTCRRTQLLRYFGETQAAETCAFCDNCLAARGETPMVDVTSAAHKLLGLVRATGQMFGATHLIEVLRGSHAQGVLKRGHDRLPAYGSGQELTVPAWRRLVAQLVASGLLEQDMDFGGLHLTPKGHDALARSSPVSVPAERAAVREATGARGAALSGDYDEALFEQLRELRRALATAANVPPFVVFSDRSLAEMATYYPQSRASFLAIGGVGERKLAEYGERFLALITAYCAERGLKERPHPGAAAAASASKPFTGTRAAEAGQLFAEGKSALEIQGIFGIGPRTLVNHLYNYVQSGHPLPADRILALSGLSEAEKTATIAAFDELGTDRLRPVFDALGESVSYDELHIIRLYCLCRANAPS
jgi:ATP-dependent DNA helicase RecQ